MVLAPLLARYDHVVADLDGCLWVGDEPTRDAPAALTALRAAGKGVAFVTNDARRSPEEFVRKLWALGFQANASEVVTVGVALQHMLVDANLDGAAALVLGSRALVDHVADAGLRIVNGTDRAARADVVVAAAHDELDYRELRLATQAVLRGAALYAAGRDATFPMPDGPWPGSGAIVAALETATGATAQSAGKPEPAIFRAALDRVGPGKALVVGDRLDADIAGAAAAGLDAALVLTGATGRAEARDAEPAPMVVAEDFAALVLGR